ncbi:conjugal transfer protein TraO [Runella limosa]|uniref:conjugal transfer protein TraO n=1 Tax=Runella limosa TaxID=370978 RepID=UPI00048E388B|nr:conjugal transfer protein TraO [Runella limosa]
MRIYVTALMWLAFNLTSFCQQLKGQRSLEISIAKIDGLRPADNSGFNIELNRGKIIGNRLIRQWGITYLRKDYSVLKQDVPVESTTIHFTMGRILFQQKGIAGLVALGGVGGYQLINRGKSALDDSAYQLTNQSRLIVGGKAKVSLIIASTVSVFTQTLWFPTSDVQKLHFAMGASIFFF